MLVRKYWLLFVCLVVLFCVACNDKSASEKASEYRVVYSGEIKTLNYLKTSETNEFAVAANMVDGLIEYDNYGVVQPGLAKEWSANEDATVWTFKLRDDAKWVTHEGKEYADVVAQDFVDGLHYVLDAKNESSTAWIATVVKNGEAFYNGEMNDFKEVGIKALDEHTVEYTLEAPTPYFLSMLNYVCFFPVNGKFIAEKGEDFGTTRENFLYNGAYILDKFEPQNERVLVKNETYWDKDKVLIDRIRYKYNKEAATVAPELFYVAKSIRLVSRPPSLMNGLKMKRKNLRFVKHKITSIPTFMHSTSTHNLTHNTSLITGKSPSIIKISANPYSMRLTVSPRC